VEGVSGYKRPDRGDRVSPTLVEDPKLCEHLIHLDLKSR